MSRETQSEKKAVLGHVRSIEAERSNGSASRLVACVLLLPEDAEPILSVLRKLAYPNGEFTPNGVSTDSQDLRIAADGDSWLGHPQAAAYLGISTSTLYHYSSRNEIERRKIAGRLEYRRSALDEFKRAHTLRASSPSIPARIISPAHSSGK